jgi:hypothetical protein
MTTVNYTAQQSFVDSAVYSWSPLTTGNADGQGAGRVGAGERTVQIEGTFGVGGTVVIEGSLNGTTWYQLHDPGNTLISFTAAGLRAILENVLFIRPRVTAGDASTSIVATLAVRLNRSN